MSSYLPPPCENETRLQVITDTKTTAMYHLITVTYLARAFAWFIKMQTSFNLLLILLHHFFCVGHGEVRSGVQWIWAWKRVDDLTYKSCSPLNSQHWTFSFRSTFCSPNAAFWSHTNSETYLRIRWSDDQRELMEGLKVQQRSLLSPAEMWGEPQRVKGQTAQWGRGFRTPCCVINNFLDSMFSPLSPFPKKAAVCASVCHKDPDKATVAHRQWFIHTHTHMHKHKLIQTQHTHIFSALYGKLPLTEPRHTAPICIFPPLR